MKQLIQLGLLSNLLLNSAAFAVNPQQGFYMGILGEISATTPRNHIVTFREIPDPTLWVGTVENNRISGGGGAMLGYRYNQFRAEGEFLYNWTGSNTVNVSNCTLLSPVVTTPRGVCPQDHFQANNLGFNGSIAAMFGMANFYWDFINYESDNGSFFPYVGLGLGYAQVTARGNFVRNYYAINTSSHGTSSKYSSTAGQGILGVGMLLDDFSWAGMDYRYLTTNTLKSFDNKRYAVNSLNFSVSFSFDKSRT